MKPTLLVLAAGIGSRYGGLKQIDPVGVNGEAIIDYSVYDAIKAGFDKLVFVIRKEIEKDFKEFIGNKYENRIRVEYVYQELSNLPVGFTVPEGKKKPWGTGQAILTAKDVINAPFAVINGDDFYGADSYKILADYLGNIDPAGNDYAMVGYLLRNTLSENGSVSRGVCTINEKGFLHEVIELTKIEKAGAAAKAYLADGSILPLTGDEIVSLNMFGFTPALFAHLERLFIEFLKDRGTELKSEYFIPSVMDSLIRGGEASVKVLSSKDNWFGITYREDSEYVARNIKGLTEKGAYPVNLF